MSAWIFPIPCRVLWYLTPDFALYLVWLWIWSTPSQETRYTRWFFGWFFNSFCSSICILLRCNTRISNSMYFYSWLLDVLLWCNSATICTEHVIYWQALFVDNYIFYESNSTPFFLSFQSDLSFLFTTASNYDKVSCILLSPCKTAVSRYSCIPVVLHYTRRFI